MSRAVKGQSLRFLRVGMAQTGPQNHYARIVAQPEVMVRRERRWSTVGVNPTRELVRSTR